MKVSVIVPVYNSEAYICETLASLQHQTFSDFEAILVDDHGTDQSIQVARRFVADDVRFRFCATPANAGPGVARNVGIEHAHGEYVAFLDGDDLLAPTFLEQLLSGTPAVMNYCQLAYKGGKREGQVHRNPVVNEDPLTPGKRRRFLRKFVTFSVCFLYQRQFLIDHQLRFPDCRNSEDTNFLTRCLLLTPSLRCVDQPLYYYCVREGSLSTGFSPRRYRQRLYALGQLMQTFRQLKQDSRYAPLHLSQYNGVMALIWFKKGLAQVLLDLLHNLVHR